MARSDYPLAIVDYVSCLEALLSPGSAELVYRLSQIIAIVSEREVDKRASRCEEFRNLYNLRSRVIHGEKQSESVEDASFADGLARMTLRLCLGYYSKGMGKMDILKDVDDVTFGKDRELPEFAFDYQ